MTIHCLNCLTCCARVPRGLETGALCLLVETDRGLLLVDTGLGREDYIHQPTIMRAFRLATKVPLDPAEIAARQVAKLGYRPEDVRHIVLTHMHFDHCGGVPDFPQAAVHLHRREYEAFRGLRRGWLNVAYVRRHMAHRPDVVLYEETDGAWFGFPAIRLPFQPEMWLIPLFGHTPGHCGVAISTGEGWIFHVGDAGPAGMVDSVPTTIARLVLGPHQSRLRSFRASHPGIRVTTGHMPLAFFRRHGT